MTTGSLEEAGVQPYAEAALCGESPAVTRLRLQIARLSPHFRTALLTGERGVGKAAVAREMHRRSAPRSLPGPFCELAIGRFAEGENLSESCGVLFLSGLDDMRPELQEPLVTRLKTIQREIRILISSGAELRGLLANGRVGPALASRVGSVEIRVPPLRERPEDLEELAQAMLTRLGTERRLSAAAIRSLQAHQWPGNLAELWQVAEHLARDATRQVADLLGPEDLPALVNAPHAEVGEVRLDQVMHKHVMGVLERCSGNKLKAAELLGISRSTLYRMLGATPAD